MVIKIGGKVGAKSSPKNFVWIVSTGYFVVEFCKLVFSMQSNKYCYLSYYPWLVTQERSENKSLNNQRLIAKDKQWSFFVPKAIGLNSSNLSLYIDSLLEHNKKLSLTEPLSLDFNTRGYSGNISCVFLHFHQQQDFINIPSEIKIKVKPSAKYVSAGAVSCAKNRYAYLYTHSKNHIVYSLPVVFLKKDLREIDFVALKKEQDVQRLAGDHANSESKLGTNNINYYINCDVIFNNSFVGSVDFAISEEEQDFSFINQWLSFFDFLLFKNQQESRGQGNILEFYDLYKYMCEFCDQEDDIGHSKIFEIIENTINVLSVIRPKIRKNLRNHLEYMKVERINQLNSKCLIDLLKLEGNTIKDKARQNKGRLLGIAKHENYNLLENRVLKSFLERAIGECNEYLRLVEKYLADPKLKASSNHYRQVKAYKIKCQELLSIPELNNVPSQTVLPKPNFVLLKDLNYKVIWKNYLSLVYAKQDFYQTVYNQQSLFQDICNLFINASLSKMAAQQDKLVQDGFTCIPLYKSYVNLSMEQIEGHRLKLGSSAGPFLLTKANQAFGTKYVLEVVSQGTERYAEFATYLTVSKQEQIAYAPTYIKLTPIVENNVNLNDLHFATQPKFIAIYNFHICKEQYAYSKDVFESFYRFVSNANASVIFLYSVEGASLSKEDFVAQLYRDDLDGLNQGPDDFDEDQYYESNQDHFSNQDLVNLDKFLPVGICTNPKYWGDCIENLQKVLIKELSKLWK